MRQAIAYVREYARLPNLRIITNLYAYLKMSITHFSGTFARP